MRRFRSLLIDRANLRVPGLHVIGVALHRHLAEHASVTLHRHAWAQALIYFSGAGEQTIGDRTWTIEAGTLVLLPPGVPHGFLRQHARSPVCLMIDFRLRGVRGKPAVVRGLSRSDLNQLRQDVAMLVRLQQGAGAACRWEGAVPVLQLLLTSLRSGGWLETATLPEGEASNPALRSLLTDLPHDQPLAQAIRRSGYQRDHLNRLVKRETGLTLGQYRDRERLAKAKELLAAGMQVAPVGAAIGLVDQSYFARWFRRHTGWRPSQWRAKSKSSHG